MLRKPSKKRSTGRSALSGVLALAFTSVLVLNCCNVQLCDHASQAAKQVKNQAEQVHSCHGNDAEKSAAPEKEECKRCFREKAGSAALRDISIAPEVDLVGLLPQELKLDPQPVFFQYSDNLRNSPRHDPGPRLHLLHQVFLN